MRITRYTHSCVRLEHAGAVLVIDPGTWSEPRALIGADAVLVTHEHVDHVDELRPAGVGVPVFAPTGARLSRVEAREVTPGESFHAAGFRVTAVGGRHTSVVDGQQACSNVGYVVNEVLLYHPGDALDQPPEPVETLFVPLHASWLKTAEAIDFVRAVSPRRAIGIHDGQLNRRGLDSVNYWLTERFGDRYRWVPPGGEA